jgi:hypothetical protein
VKDVETSGPGRFRRWLVVATVATVMTGGCGEPVRAPAGFAAPWDTARAEVVQWQSDDPSFAQNFAVEASGLAATDSFLYIPSEKYSRLLVFELGGSDRVGLVRLDVPPHSELEGVAVTDDGLLFCDEAHAAVYEMAPAGEDVIAAARNGLPVAVSELELEGVAVRGGKIGFEGIETNPETGEVLLLLERSGDEESGCVSRIYRLRRSGSALVAQGDPVTVSLEDCAWRLTGLAWWKGRLIALKTQFPGERYEIVAVDLVSGATDVLLDLTDLLRSLEAEGWSNNVEGVAVTSDGALWLVADNAVTGVIDDPLPPSIDVRTLLLRIPASGVQ